MKNYFNTKIKPVISTIAILIFWLFFGVLVSRAGWWPSSGNPPFFNVSETLHTGSNQTKEGGLILNKASGGTNRGANIGFIVGDDSRNPSSTGRIAVGIPLDPYVLNDFINQLNRFRDGKVHLDGNLGITGIIAPNGNSGNVNEILAKTDTTSMDWQKRASWITLVSVPTTCSSVISAPSCISIGYAEYGSEFCIQDSSSEYDIKVRVCQKQF
ncbi:MAG TPA: hypothetical protein VJB92_01485 [Candidatus Paceibacterota bacterium]